MQYEASALMLAEEVVVVLVLKFDREVESTDLSLMAAVKLSEMPARKIRAQILEGVLSIAVFRGGKV